MRIRFVRDGKKPDRIYVRLDSGAETSWTFPTYGDGLPHDLVHLVVESAFGVRGGFWGRVAAGVDVARINEEANRRGGADKYAGLGGERRSLLLAEALAGLPWSMSELDEEHLLRTLRESCERIGVEVPEGATEEGLRAARGELDRLRLVWRDLVPKGTLEMELDVGKWQLRRP